MKHILTIILYLMGLCTISPLLYSQHLTPKGRFPFQRKSLASQWFRVSPKFAKDVYVSRRVLLQAQQDNRKPSFPSLRSDDPQPVRIQPLQHSVPFRTLTALPIRKQWMAFPGKRQVDAVIFDLDGTLLNSLSVWEHSGSNFVRSQGFEPPAELDDQLVKMSLLDGAQLIKDTYHLPYTLEEIVEMTLRPIKNHYYQDIQPMPGIPEVLARLKAQGVKMAVATASYKEFAQVALARLGLADYFDFIITCDEVGVGKTSPKVYEVAAERLGSAKERTLVAEDALHALQTASRAGFKTAAVEEIHSAHQQQEKQAIADYYVISFQGIRTLKK